jgi:DNA (cytosine-5)-methyltransferase 1
MKPILAADLFCGAGGTSTGLLDACREIGRDADLLAVNHWDKAIESHSANHPDVRHLCESLDNLDPRKVVPGGYLDLLWASPECTHHSNARGGKPCSDQSRATPWHVLRWCEALRVENVIIENVREFQNWGPLGNDGRPLKSKRGQTFQAFLAALGSLNYTVEHRVLVAANYGDPTTRQRLFIIARRGRKRIDWPQPTHRSASELSNLFGAAKPWRTAREIIDWDRKGKSIFSRKKPLSPNTMRRIVAGLRKFGGEAFLTKYYGSGVCQSVDRPIDTITSRDRYGLVEPKQSDARLDILFRMLEPGELAQGQGFPKGYKFAGNREAQVKQIGNAVPCGVAKALCLALLGTP